MLSFMQGRVPLSLFWFLYLGAQGIFFPYYSLYLKENARLSGTEVGLVLAIIPLVEILAQTFWGQVAAGEIASNAAAGWLLEHVGPNAPYVASGLGAFVLGSLVWWIVPPPEVSALDSDP